MQIDEMKDDLDELEKKYNKSKEVNDQKKILIKC